MKRKRKNQYDSSIVLFRVRLPLFNYATYYNNGLCLRDEFNHRSESLKYYLTEII